MGLLANLVPPEELAKLSDREDQILIDVVQNELQRQLADPDVQAELKKRLEPALSKSRLVKKS